MSKPICFTNRGYIASARREEVKLVIHWVGIIKQNALGFTQNMYMI